MVKLNEKQRTVAENLTDNILLLASAGTGKTATLSVRISNMIQRGYARPDEILCLTFTNRACREMQERIESIVGSDSVGVTVRTIHSFGYLLLREYGNVLGDITNDISICDDDDTDEITREILVAKYMEDGTEHLLRYSRMFAGFFELAKHQMYRSRATSVSMVVPIVFRSEDKIIRERLCQDSSFKFDSYAYDFLKQHAVTIMKEYQALLTDRKLLDFQDLIFQMGLLIENISTRSLLRERYRYVHIDEVQDISDIEFDILTKMFPDATFLLCGDINQTIYEWRGSVPETILPGYLKDFNATQVILNQNYRSTQGLINLGERFTCRVLTGDTAPTVKYSDNDLQIKQFGTETEQARWIYQKVRDLPVNGDYSKIAILCRSNSQCDKLANNFASIQSGECRGDVRFLLAEEFKLFKRKEIKDILAFVRLMINRSEDTALRRISELYFRLSKKMLDDIRDQKYSQGTRLSDYISPLTCANDDYFSILCNALNNGAVVVFDTETTGVDIYKEQIIQVAAVRINGRVEVLEQYVEFIKPSKSVGKSENVHHYSDNFLARNGKKTVDVLSKLSAFLTGKVVVGHNVGYDMGILSTELARNGLPEIQLQGVYDTLDIARRYLPDSVNYKLGTISETLNTKHKPSHDALDDILATADVLVTLRKH